MHDENIAVVEQVIAADAKTTLADRSMIWLGYLTSISVVRLLPPASRSGLTPSPH